MSALFHTVEEAATCMRARVVREHILHRSKRLLNNNDKMARDDPLARPFDGAGAAAYGEYEGQNRRKLPCNHTESVMLQTAIKQLGACSDIEVDDVRNALIQQAHHASMFGGEELEELNACLRTLRNQDQKQAQERQGGPVLDNCQKYLDKAEANDGSPGWKVASKLKHDPEYCSCVRLINVDVGPNCTGFGVVSGAETGPRHDRPGLACAGACD